MKLKGGLSFLTLEIVLFAILLISFSSAFTDNGQLIQNVSSCGVLNTTNAVYTLNQSISSTSTCLILNASNIILDCVDNQISYSSSSQGNGIVAGNLNNITIENCNVVQESPISNSWAVSLSNISDSTVTDGEIYSLGNSSHSLRLYRSNRNIISNINITSYNSYSSYGLSISSSSNNTIKNCMFNKTLGNKGNVQIGGAYLNESLNNTLSNNTFVFYVLSPSSYSVELYSYSNHTKLLNNNFPDEICKVGGCSSSGSSVHIYNSGSNVLDNNNFSKSSILLDDGARYNAITNNKIEGGIGVNYGAGDNLFRRNTIECNGSSAIMFISFGFDVRNITLKENTFFGCGYDSPELDINDGGVKDIFLINQPITSYFIDNYYGNVSIILENTSLGNMNLFINGAIRGSNLSRELNLLSGGYVYLNESNQGLNVSANISLYNLNTDGYANFNIYRNGVVCNSSSVLPCVNLTSLAQSNVSFNISMGGNYTVKGVDIQIPSIILFSPVNGTSSTDSGYNFTFNSSDNSGFLANCSLFVDGSIVNLAKNLKGGTNGLFNSSFDIGTHTWSVNCTDYSGNTANSTIYSFTVTQSSSGGDSSSGGGGGGGAGDAGAVITNTQLDQGISQLMFNGQKITIQLPVSGGSSTINHTITVSKIVNKTISLTIQSDPINVTLAIGEEKKLSINSKDHYDLYLRLNSISSINRANLTIKSIYEPLIFVAVNNTSENVSDQKPVNSTGTLENIERNLKNYNLYIIIGLILLVAIVLFIVIKIYNN